MEKKELKKEQEGRGGEGRENVDCACRYVYKYPPSWSPFAQMTQRWSWFLVLATKRPSLS